MNGRQYDDDRRRYGVSRPEEHRTFEGEHDIGESRGGPRRSVEGGWGAGESSSHGYSDRPYAHRDEDYNYDPRGDRGYSYSGARGAMVSPEWDHYRGDVGPYGREPGSPYERPVSGRRAGYGARRSGYPHDTGARFAGADYGPGYRTMEGPSAWAATDEQMARRRDFRGHGPRGYQRSDERLNEEICERMTEDPDIDPREVSVRVQSGVVTLEGRVEDRWMKHHIEDLVDACSGVRNIENRIRVGPALPGNAGQPQDGGSSSQH